NRRKVDRRALPGRQQTENNPRENRSDSGKPKDAAVEREIQANRSDTVWDQHHAKVADPFPNEQAACPAKQGEEHAFGEHLADKPESPGPEGQTNGDLLPA